MVLMDSRMVMVKINFHKVNLEKTELVQFWRIL